MRFPRLVAVIAVATLTAAPAASGAVAAVGVAGVSNYSFLASVSCPSAMRCMAVGASTDATGGSRTLAERWDGTSWSIVATFNLGGPRANNHLWSVSCASATSCAAVGDTYGGAVPLAEQWNGAAWSLVRAPLPAGARRATLTSVSCPDPSNCIAVGSVNDNSGITPTTLVEAWNGSRWSVVPNPNPPGAIASGFWAVNCDATSSCTAVGNTAEGPGAETTLVEHGNGSAWAIVASPGVPGTETSLEAVACRSASACTATGAIYRSGSNSYTAAPLVERETNGAWRVIPAPSPTGTSYDQLGGVACVRARCIGVGSAESTTAISTLVESGTAHPWSITPSPNASGPLSAFAGISCPTDTHCIAVGDNDSGNGTRLPFSEESNGSVWTVLTTPNP
jgi:hypothetical protein